MKNVLKIVALVLALTLIAVLAVSPIPVAGAEELADVIPTFEAVELSPVATPVDLGQDTPYAPHTDGYSEDGMSYRDETLYVQVKGFRYFNTDILVTYVQVADGSQLRAAGNGRFPSNSTTRAVNLAKREKAVLAINGDYIVHMNTGYSVRNGKVLRERYNDTAAHDYDALLVDTNGDFTIITQMDGDRIKAWNETHEIAHAFTFGPALVVDGVKNEYYPIKDHVPKKRTQRMAIGQLAEKTYVIVTTDGPDDKNSTGLTMSELADVFVALGAKQAYNLDGGSSSWLVLNNTMLNGRHGSKHRPIADIIYFVTAAPEGGVQ